MVQIGAPENSGSINMAYAGPGTPLALLKADGTFVELRQHLTQQSSDTANSELGLAIWRSARIAACATAAAAAALADQRRERKPHT